MQASFLRIITALSTFIAFTRTGVFSNSVNSTCEVTFTEECDLRWSTERQTFLMSSLSNNSNSFRHRRLPTLDQIADNRTGSSLCIRAPKGHYIALELVLDPAPDENAPSQSNGCDPTSSPNCTTVCVAVRLPENKEVNRPVNDLANGSVLQEIFLNFFNLKRTQNFSHDNSTKFNEHIERFPRHSVSLSRNVTKITRISKEKPSKGRHRTSGCKKCSPRQNRSRRRRPGPDKRRRWKLATNLLIEIHQAWLKDREARRNKTRGGNGLKHSPSLDMKAARERILRLINSSRRRRKSTPRELPQQNQFPVSNSLQQIPLRTENTVSVITSRSATEGSESLQRGKRLAATPATTFHSNEQQPSFQSYTLCGHGPGWNVSAESGDADMYFGFNSTQESVSTDFPLSFNSTGREMRMNILHNLPAYGAALQLVRIKIYFFPNQKETEKTWITTNYVTNDDINPTRTQELSSSASASGDRTVLDVSNCTDGQVPVVERYDGIHVIIGVATGGFLVLVLTAICLIFLYRKKRRATSKPSQCDFVDEGETEKCLSAVENCETRPDYSSPRKQTRLRNPGHNMAEVNECRMLEHKKQKRGHHKPGKAHRKEETTDSRKNHEAKHKQQGRQHVTQCKHLLTMRGSSRHEHCIVCQIAGKPHQPITDAQYASEFLPPASRHNNNAGSNCIVQGSQDNFDKFNRMQNNPYRHSPSLTPKNASLPLTVNLPDGEERYRGRRDPKLHAEGYREPVCIKPPPNRTIFASEALPFSASGQQKHSGKPNGYPGPPTSISKSVTYERTGRDHHPRSAHKDDCICRFIMNHIDEPPPEYSDVIRDEPLPREAASSTSFSGTPKVGFRKSGVSHTPPNT